MSAVEESKTGIGVQHRVVLPAAATETVATATSNVASSASAKARSQKLPLIPRALKLLSSVRFGVTLLVIMIALCMTGMLIMQQDVEGFTTFYAALTPSQKLVYGSLGFFDIYHVWYFNLLLIVLSLNIVLASIDRFPGAWIYIRKPKLQSSLKYLQVQKQTATYQMHARDAATLATQVAEACRKTGYKARVTERAGRQFVFAERGVWNRLGAYAVHVALLTIFAGGFMLNNFGRNGTIELSPEAVTSRMMERIVALDRAGVRNVPLPFTIVCTDIQQKLIDKQGNLMPSNTLDWLTRVKILDGDRQIDATISLNKPYDFRGYRFFQASFDPQVSARSVKLRLTPTQGAPIFLDVPRNGSAKLPDGTQFDYLNFFPDFQISGGIPTTISNEYLKPAALLRVTMPDGKTEDAYAFALDLPTGAPVDRAIGGYKMKLVDFEKVSNAHVLSVKYDPLGGTNILYAGFILLIATLIAVFFFSHERVWAIVEPSPDTEADMEDAFTVTVGANTNRNQQGLSERFKRLCAQVEAKD